jgi:peptidoglycan/LPS O-acetylase OafA/YrhL
MSDTKKPFHRNSFVYLLIALLLALTGFIYEHFSHDIYSYSMMYAFSVPLVLGTLLNMILERLRAHSPGSLTRQLWHCGVATLTIGLLVSGVFQIYGSASIWINVYYPVGALLLLISGILYFTHDRK